MKAYIGLGSNIGDREVNIRRALDLLGEHSGIIVAGVSSLYETAPVGYVDQPDFINAVAILETDLSPHELLAVLLKVEEQMGRVRTIRWGPRVIDIDILLYGDVQVEENDLQVPHPRMMERRFVLEPLAEIAPDLVLPDGRTAKDAAEEIIVQERLQGDAPKSHNNSIG